MRYMVLTAFIYSVAILIASIGAIIILDMFFTFLVEAFRWFWLIDGGTQ